MAPADLARTDWYRAILLEKVARVWVAGAEARAAVDPVGDLAARADLVDPLVAVVLQAAQAVGCLAELLVAEEEVAEAECLAGAAD